MTRLQLALFVFIAGSSASGIPAEERLSAEAHDVDGFAMTADGLHAVYRSVSSTETALFSVPMDGGDPVRLSVAGRAASFKLLPDGRGVIYRMHRPLLDRFDLFAVPVEGPAQESELLAEDVSNFWVSPDSEHVVISTATGLHSLTLGVSGATPIWILGGPGMGLGSGSVAFTSDGGRVVAALKPGGASVVQVHSASIDGPRETAVQLDQGDDVYPSSLRVTDDRVLYRARTDPDDVWYGVLYSAPIEGPASARVALFPALGDDRRPHQAEPSPDGTFVVVEAQDFNGSSSASDDLWHLLRVPMAGPATDALELKANPLPGPAGANPVGVQTFFFTGGGAGLLYDELSRVGNDFYAATFSVSTAGPASGYEYLADLLLPDRREEALAADPAEVVLGRSELLGVPLSGPSTAAVQLNPPLAPGGAIGTRTVAPDESRVVYRADVDGSGAYHVFSAPAFGPSSQTFQVSRTPFRGGEGSGAIFGLRLTVSPDSRTVLYLGGGGERVLLAAEIGPLFADGFESGTSDAWSRVGPE